MIYPTSRVWACCSFGLEWPFTFSPSSEALLQVSAQMPPLPSSYRMGSGCPPPDSQPRGSGIPLCGAGLFKRHSTPPVHFPFLDGRHLSLYSPQMPTSLSSDVHLAPGKCWMILEGWVMMRMTTPPPCISSACHDWSQSSQTFALSQSWFVLAFSAVFSNELVSRASVSLPVNDLQSLSSQRSYESEVDTHGRMCLEWRARHTEGIIVLHISPLDCTADYLAR